MILNDSETFIEYSNNINDIFKNIEEYNPNKKCKILIVFDEMIAALMLVKVKFQRVKFLKLSLIWICFESDFWGLNQFCYTV